MSYIILYIELTYVYITVYPLYYSKIFMTHFINKLKKWYTSISVWRRITPTLYVVHLLFLDDTIYAILINFFRKKIYIQKFN